MTLKLIIINFLTLIRVIGTIILIPIYNYCGGKVVGIISLICYLTDSIDGLLARKFKASTFFGALFDGIADKLFTIVNFIILFMITPYAIIPIIIEILIIIIQLFKYHCNLNIKSNVIGKAKVWILAISVVITFLISDISSISYVSTEFKNWFLDIPDNVLYLYLLMPAIIMEVLTLISYIREIFLNSGSIKVIKREKTKMPHLKSNEFLIYFKNVWLNPEFYHQHKDDPELKKLKKNVKEDIKKIPKGFSY